MYSINWEENALKQFEKFELILRRRIVKKIDELVENPFTKDIKHLKNIDAFGYRIGDYRIIFEIKGHIINILKIGHRKNIYDF